MRVTSQMIMDRTIFNLSRNVSRLMVIESQLSTGRRINTPSDDPIGTQHALNYRTRLTEISQYISNINSGNRTMATYENSLADLNNYFLSAKQVALSMASDNNTGEAGAWLASANEVRSILDQVIQLANTNQDGKYLYSGHLTRSASFLISSNGAEYQGDLGVIDLEIDSGSRVQKNFIGQNIFLKQFMTLGEDTDFKIGIDLNTVLSDLNMGSGIDLGPGTFEVLDNNLNNPAIVIDLNNPIPPTTIDDVVTNINNQLTAAGSALQVAVSESGASLKWLPSQPPTNSISSNTPLVNLNGGTGIYNSPPEVLVHNADDSISFSINLSGAGTVGDVITAMQAEFDARLGAGVVVVGYNVDGNGLSITDTSGVPLGLEIGNVTPEATTADDLGIVGTLDPSLSGNDLKPRQDFSISDIGAQTTAADLGLAADINNEYIGSSLNPQVTINSPLSLLNSKSGFNLGQIRISQGSSTALIDLTGANTVGDVLDAINASGLEISASINASMTGIQVTTTVADKTLIIENEGVNRSANDLGIAGSPDMIGSMMLLVKALENEDQELVGRLIENMDLSMKELISSRALVGARMAGLNTTLNRLEATNVSLTKVLSETEDADIIYLISELAKQENLYKAALLASSKTMQMSLVDFIR